MIIIIITIVHDDYAGAKSYRDLISTVMTQKERHMENQGVLLVNVAG